MPRDSNGKFTLPSGTLVNEGDTVLPSQHNPAMLDIEQALTNSMTRNGSGQMTGNLPMNNNRITGMAAGVNPNDAVTVGQLGSLGVPLGGVIDFWGDVPPTGYLFPYGQAVSREDYADLFAVIGTSAGSGDGSTTFNLPDYRAVVSAGRADMGGTIKSLLSDFAATTLGAIFGSQSHVLTTAQMPSHTHSGSTNSAGAHTHPINLYTSTQEQQLLQASTSRPGLRGTVNTGSAGAHTHSFTTNAQGSGQAHPNVQPTIICNKIMRVQ